MTAAAPSAPPRPAPPPPPPPDNGAPSQSRTFTVQNGRIERPQKIGIYGEGGVGKTSLAPLLAEVNKKVILIDADDGSAELDIDRIAGIKTFTDVRDVLYSNVIDKYDVLFLDTVTTVQDWIIKHLCDSTNSDSLESVDGGYGKGYRRLYESMVQLQADLEGRMQKGQDIVIVMHDIINKTANPDGEDFPSHSPNLYHSDKVSIRHRWLEWLDHMFFIGRDVAVTKKGKGIGGQARTIYPGGSVTYMAKSRRIREPIPYIEGDAELWRQMFNVSA